MQLTLFHVQLTHHGQIPVHKNPDLLTSTVTVHHDLAFSFVMNVSVTHTCSYFQNIPQDTFISPFSQAVDLGLRKYRYGLSCATV